VSDSNIAFLEGPGFGCFFIIGAMKAGTGSLYHYLAGHPDIYASPVKEPKFFANPSPSDRELREYRALFDGRTTERWVFEASGAYSKHPHRNGVPERIQRMAPEARFIYVLRHPVERVFSAYTHNLAHGRERRPVRQAVVNDGYLDVSRYHLQLDQYLKIFPRNRILVLLFEDLVTQRAETVHRVFRFLGLTEDVPLDSLDRHFNETSRKRAPGPVLRALSAIPGYRQAPWKVRRFCYERWSVPLPPRQALVDAALYNDLLDALADDIEQLKSLLGDDLQRWDLSYRV
jgi:hypothetical protein